MSNARTVLDPTSERTVAVRQQAARLPSLEGRTLALLDISKPRGEVFLDRLAGLLSDRGAAVRRFRKPTFSKVAPIDLRYEIATTCDGVIEALAD